MARGNSRAESERAARASRARKADERNVLADIKTKEGANAYAAMTHNNDLLNAFPEEAIKALTESINGTVQYEVEESSGSGTMTFDAETTYFKVGGKIYELKTPEFEVEYERGEVGYRGDNSVYGGIPTTANPSAQDLLMDGKLRSLSDKEVKSLGLMKGETPTRGADGYKLFRGSLPEGVEEWHTPDRYK
jgi:hypothetical protein